MLHVHRAERADRLVAALGELLAEPLPDPFAREVLSVPTRGIERWLTQQLSAQLGASPARADGVCANVDFPTPRRLIADAVAAAAGIDPEADPWLPERSLWPLLALLDGPAVEPDRRFAAARRLADLFDRYALHRPDMLRAWAAGEDGGIPADATWQREHWRRLRAQLGAPDPAVRLRGAEQRLREDPAVLDLPARISLFGLTRLPAGHLRILRAIAVHRDVQLFLLHPSPALWEEIAAAAPDVVRRTADPTVGLARNRLLASWGHDVRELQLVLGRGDGFTDHHHPLPATGDDLLARLQAGVRENREPEPGAADRSVEVHSCHGRARQVEVLRDAILHLLEEDPALEPRDVIVMCPDIETFAPLIQATFGAGEVSEGDDEADALPPELRPPDLRVRLADRALRQTNPVLGVIARLLELGDERLTASQVLDLADREPVRRRFGFDDDALARIEQWVRASGIRWGLDAEHRAPFKLETLPTGTWQAGLNRLLLGVTMTEDEQRLFANVLPLDDVDSGVIDLAGRFAELLARLRASIDALTRSQPIGEWPATLAAAADQLTATTQRDAWQRGELQRLLDDVVGDAAGHETELGLAEVRALLADRLRGRPTRANFRTGHLTICTLVPMRSVPHRVVCLLGLDDGVFPRKSPRDGDDLLLADPHVGERDARTEDRQQLLDALMAATDRLLITYTGNDERTNLPRPPAVPVGELLDVIARTTDADIVVRHPLQPFDARNFVPGELVPGEPWSFDRVTLRGARALAGERALPGRFLAAPLPPLDAPAIELEDLVHFLERPVRTMLEQRLGIRVGEYADEIEDRLPVHLEPLDKARLGQRLLDARLAGAEPRAAALAEIARGALPPGELGLPVIHEVHPVVEGIVERLPEGEPRSVDVAAALPDGRTVRGTVPEVCGGTVRVVRYARLRAPHRLRAWVRLLVLTVAHPDRSFRSVAIGRDGTDRGVVIARVEPVPVADAVAYLVAIVDLYDRAMREPPPLACLTSAAYAEAARSGGDPVKAARSEWESTFGFEREDQRPEHELVHGGVVSFAALLAEPPRADETGPGWDPDETRRFGRWARRLWDPLLALEVR